MEESWANPFLTIVNKSATSVTFLISELYPDTTYQKGHYTMVPANDQGDYTYYLSRKELFKKYPVMQVFAITEENIKLPKDTIRKYQLYERYELTKEQLEKDNWTIVYPKNSIK